MFKTIFIIVLFFTFGLVFRPYLVDLIGYFNIGLEYLQIIFGYIIKIISTFLNALASHYYIMFILIIMLTIVIFTRLISSLGGGKWKNSSRFFIWL